MNVHLPELEWLELLSALRNMSEELRKAGVNSETVSLIEVQVNHQVSRRDEQRKIRAKKQRKLKGQTK